MRHIDARPGLSLQSLRYLRQKVEEDPVTYGQCSLMLDGMSLRKELQWDASSNEIVGCVDLGGIVEGSEDPQIATEALVFMAVGMNAPWKIPIAYFFTTGLNGSIQAQLLSACLKALNDHNVHCMATVMDGLPANIRMITLLGASCSIDNMKPFFPHPSTNNPVNVFFDACHLIKNIRTSFHALSQVYTPVGIAYWQHLVRLQELQYVEGLRAANKITKDHILFHNNKMKVKLAVQTLSQSAAQTLLYCHNIKLRHFEDCPPTAEFISIFDRVFDIFNSRSLLCKGFKAPISRSNWEEINVFLESAKMFISQLKDVSGKLLTTTKLKMGFLGFVFNINSLQLLIPRLLSQDSPQKYFCTVRLSQDHLEMFFTAVRQRGGFNNNPSCLSFRRTYKALLSHAGVSLLPNSNCIAQDDTYLMTIPKIPIEIDPQDDDEMPNLDVSDTLSTFCEGILEYIAGWVVRKISKKIDCKICLLSLVRSVHSTDPMPILISLKNNGGLVCPSNSVVTVIKHCEKYIRSVLDIHCMKKSQWESIATVKILSSFHCKVFEDLSEHFIESSCGLDVNHYYSLLKLIVTEFIRLRRFHAIKTANIYEIRGRSVWHKLTKGIIFRHQ
jgi:hypothetical protein